MLPPRQRLQRPTIVLPHLDQVQAQAKLEQTMVAGGRRLKVIQALPRPEEQGTAVQRVVARLAAGRPPDITNQNSPLGNHHARVTYYRAVVAAGISGGAIAHQFCAGCPQVFDRGQHGDGRAVAAHGNVFFPNNFIKSSGV